MKRSRQLDGGLVRRSGASRKSCKAEATVSRPRAGKAGVMRTEGRQSMCIRGGQERLAVGRCDPARAAVEVEEPFVEMANFDRIEAIDLLNKAFA